MKPFHLISGSLLLGIVALGWPAAGQAAESYDNCTGFIDSVPATISAQGTWCLRRNLGTGIAYGAAITVAANNVTIDCNGFKLGGLAAGNNSYTDGIIATDRQNVTVRQCVIRGFDAGIYIVRGAGHLIEDNRLDNNLSRGITVLGHNSLVRRNQVFDTGGRTGGGSTYGINADADLIDNMVVGLFVDKPGGIMYGITTKAPGAVVRGNRVSGFDMNTSGGGVAGHTYGISASGARSATLSGNSAVGPGNGTFGIHALSSSFCMANTATGFSNNINPNCHGSGNLSH